MHPTLSETAAPGLAIDPATNSNPKAAFLALAVGGFAIGTGEFAIMGLLPEVARDLGVSIPTAGHVITSYAMGVVIGAPVLAVLCARWRQRTLLMALMLVFALGNFASALAPNYLALNILRFAAGLPHGTYFGVAALVAASLARPGRRASAIATVMMGLTIAIVVGVPISALLGEFLGWRAAFAFVGSLGLLAAFMVRRAVPDIAPHEHASPWRELGALRRVQVWLTLGVGAIGFGGLFAVFSYAKPTLLAVSGLPAAWVPVVLSVFGMGMVAGNVIGARMADQNLLRTIGLVLVWSILVLGAFTFTAANMVTATLTIFLIGTTGALSPPIQSRLMDVAGDAQTLAAALHHSAFNLANGLGAWLGGLAIAGGLGWTSTGWVGALMALGGLAVFGVSLAVNNRSSLHAAGAG
ncbi:MAG: MFS transporter [Janthinobacterium lividum]